MFLLFMQQTGLLQRSPTWSTLKYYTSTSVDQDSAAGAAHGDRERGENTLLLLKVFTLASKVLILKFFNLLLKHFMILNESTSTASGPLVLWVFGLLQSAEWKLKWKQCGGDLTQLTVCLNVEQSSTSFFFNLLHHPR